MQLHPVGNDRSRGQRSCGIRPPEGRIQCRAVRAVRRLRSNSGTREAKVEIDDAFQDDSFKPSSAPDAL